MLNSFGWCWGPWSCETVRMAASLWCEHSELHEDQTTTLTNKMMARAHRRYKIDGTHSTIWWMPNSIAAHKKKEAVSSSSERHRETPGTAASPKLSEFPCHVPLATTNKSSHHAECRCQSKEPKVCTRIPHAKSRHSWNRRILARVATATDVAREHKRSCAACVQVRDGAYGRLPAK